MDGICIEYKLTFASVVALIVILNKQSMYNSLVAPLSNEDMGYGVLLFFYLLGLLWLYVQSSLGVAF